MVTLTTKISPRNLSNREKVFTERTAIVCRLREDGLSYSEIVSQTSIPKTTVARICKQNLDNK